MAQEMKIYTKTGDDGTTGLAGGTRVKKYDKRLEAYGTVDELNSHIGLILSTAIDEHSKKILLQIQHKLFSVGAQLADDGKRPDIKDKVICSDQDIELLEKEMDKMTDVLPSMKHFILPNGVQGAAFAQVARTVCRRAERCIVHVSSKTPVDTKLVKYINRLSDYLFLLSRKINFDHNVTETPWIPGE